MNPTVSIYNDTSLTMQINQVLKRLTDIFVSTIVLIFIFPWAYIILALRIRWTLKESVIFKQERTGMNGKVFTCYKFRTMLPASRPQRDVMDDEEYRITKLGGYLRLSGLDELPQFWNVLKGDMAVVGPRPHKLSHDVEYARIVSDYALRYAVKPGITGWAQVNGFRGPVASSDDIRKRVEYDIWYIQNGSLWLDMKIMVKTFGIIWKKL